MLGRAGTGGGTPVLLGTGGGPERRIGNGGGNPLEPLITGTIPTASETTSKSYMLFELPVCLLKGGGGGGGSRGSGIFCK